MSLLSLNETEEATIAIAPHGREFELERISSRLARRVRELEAEQQALTERALNAETAMRHLARLATIGELTAGLAHEINNPLCGLTSGLYLLETLPPDEARFREVLRLIRTEVTRLAAITGRLRANYQPEHTERTDCDLNAMLRDALELARIQAAHRVAISLDAPESPVVIHASDGQLRQVFLNLMLNAIAAMPNGGKLSVRLAREADVVVVDVEDTGVGIPAEIRAHLFEPFNTDKPEGTGLGLYISGRIVAEHNGRIDVETNREHGTIFRIVLPYGTGACAQPACSPGAARSHT